MGLRALKVKVGGEWAWRELCVIPSEPGAREAMARGSKIALTEDALQAGAWLFAGRSGGVEESDARMEFEASLPEGFFVCFRESDFATQTKNSGLTGSALEAVVSWRGDASEANALIEAGGWREAIKKAARSVFARSDEALWVFERVGDKEAEDDVFGAQKIVREALGWQALASRLEALELERECRAATVKTMGARL